jgi:protease secretion system membrane fusion protein
MSEALVAAAPPSPADDALRVARRGAFGLALGLGGFLAFAALAPLGQGVAASGVVAVAGERKVVQALHGGAIEKLLVREGERVARGQLLIQLNTVQARAQEDVVLGQWIGARSAEARLVAERLGRAKIAWPEDLLALAAEPRAKEAMELQQALFETRRSELANRQQVIEHEKRALEEQLAGLREIEASFKTQLELQREEREELRSLVDQGYLPRNRLIAAERAVAQLTAQRASSIAEIGRSEQALHENALKRLQATEAFRREAETELSEVATRAANLTEQRKALAFEVESGGIVAPASGRVIGLEAHTEGGVLAPLQRVMEIVPERSAWVVQARFEPLLAERLAPGLAVDLRFATLERAHTPVIAGRVVTVSADQLRDERSGEAYFAVEIAPAPEAEGQLREAQLEIKPGMQVEAVVTTGERTLASYLLKPLRERLAAAFHEA